MKSPAGNGLRAVPKNFPWIPECHFWEATDVADMPPEQWESLCDGCAKCCLEKVEDADTGRIHYTNVVCRLLDPDTCRCGDYAERARIVPSCITLTPAVLEGPPVAPCHLVPTG